MSILVILYSHTTTRLCMSLLYRSRSHFEYSSAVTSDLPSGIAVLIHTRIFNECQSVDLLPREILEVASMCHVRKASLIPLLSLRMRF